MLRHSMSEWNRDWKVTGSDHLSKRGCIRSGVTEWTGDSGRWRSYGGGKSHVTSLLVICVHWERVSSDNDGDTVVNGGAS